MMKEMITVGRTFIAIALLAFGIQHFIYLEFVTRAFPVIPLWIPGHAIWACLFGGFLFITGLSILLGIKTRLLTALLGSTILLMFLLLLLPSLITNLNNGIIWTNAGKALVIAGANFLVAASYPADANKNKLINLLEKLIPLGKYFLSGFFILAGILHFIYAPFVATLVPNWIPAHLFWTYFAGIALIAGAIGMLVPRTAQLAATLSAIMVFIWVIILHIPRALADLHNPNETTATFEALTMCGMAILVAVYAALRKNK